MHNPKVATRSLQKHMEFVNDFKISPGEIMYYNLK